MNATVTLSLGEIDGLRNELIEAKAKLAESEAHQRTMQVNVTENWEFMEHGTERVYDYDRNSGRGYQEPSYRHTMKSVRKSLTNWYNLDDVMGLLKKSAEDAVQTQTNELKATIARRDTTINDIQAGRDAQSEEIRKLSNKVKELQKIEVENTLVESLKKEMLEKVTSNANLLFKIAELEGRLQKRSLWSRVFD